MPANPQKGEVEFMALGREWLLRFDTNAICILEDELDQGISAVAQLLQIDPRMSMIRAVFRGGIVGGASLEETNQILDEIGAEAAARLITRAFDVSLLLATRESGSRPTIAPKPASISRAS